MATQLRLATHSSHLDAVVEAFESELGLPVTKGADIDWLHRVVADFNEANDTNIAYDHEDYGYWFRCETTKESRLLGDLREKYRLGGE